MLGVGYHPRPPAVGPSTLPDLIPRTEADIWRASRANSRLFLNLKGSMRYESPTM